MSILLEKIYQELKFIRQDLRGVLPLESLAEYSNSKSIIASYKDAIGEYHNSMIESDGDN